jgi:hypothetical protein
MGEQEIECHIELKSMPHVSEEAYAFLGCEHSLMMMIMTVMIIIAGSSGDHNL